VLAELGRVGELVDAPPHGQSVDGADAAAKRFELGLAGLGLLTVKRRWALIGHGKIDSREGRRLM
jgi:hypothetical protein